MARVSKVVEAKASEPTEESEDQPLVVICSPPRSKVVEKEVVEKVDEDQPLVVICSPPRSKVVEKVVVEKVDEEVPLVEEVPSIPTYNIGDHRDPHTTSFSLVAEDGTIFGTGKQSVITIKENQIVNIELTQGLLNKFLLIKWLRPKSFSDITGVVTSPSVPPFSISFTYDQEQVIAEADSEGVKYPSRYEIEGCSIESIELINIAGTNVAFTKATITATGIKVKMDELETLKPPVVSSYGKTDFI
jgi:hypothetical protein